MWSSLGPRSTNPTDPTELKTAFGTNVSKSKTTINFGAAVADRRPHLFYSKPPLNMVYQPVTEDTVTHALPPGLYSSRRGTIISFFLLEHDGTFRLRWIDDGNKGSVQPNGTWLQGSGHVEEVAVTVEGRSMRYEIKLQGDFACAIRDEGLQGVRDVSDAAAAPDDNAELLTERLPAGFGAGSGKKAKTKAKKGAKKSPKDGKSPEKKKKTGKSSSRPTLSYRPAEAASSPESSPIKVEAKVEVGKAGKADAKPAPAVTSSAPLESYRNVKVETDDGRTLLFAEMDEEQEQELVNSMESQRGGAAATPPAPLSTPISVVAAPTPISIVEVLDSPYTIHETVVVPEDVGDTEEAMREWVGMMGKMSLESPSGVMCTREIRALGFPFNHGAREEPEAEAEVEKRVEKVVDLSPLAEEEEAMAC